jgi:hypothetical protein
MGNKHCLKCKEKLDDQTATDGSGTSPEEGNISICLYCANLAVYKVEDGELVIAPISEEDRKNIESDPDIMAAVAWVKSANVWFAP